MHDDSSLLDASSKYADSVEGGSVEDASATDGQTDDGSVYSINLPPTDTEVTTDAEATDSSAPASPKRRPPRRALLSSLEPVEGTPELAEPTPPAEAAEGVRRIMMGRIGAGGSSPCAGGKVLAPLLALGKCRTHNFST